MTIGVLSLEVPLNDGIRLLDGDFGAFNVTVGAAASTLNVTGLLTPGEFPAELGWLAIAAYWPLTSGGLALLEPSSWLLVQLPAVPSAAASETTAPFGSAPA